MCKIADCGKGTVGKSKYCLAHKTIARAAWKAMIAEKAEARETRLRGYYELWERAKAAGVAAGEAMTPVPMIVSQHEDILDDHSPVKKAWIVPSGVCGFASIIIRPGNCSFAHYAKKYHGANKAYYGGMSIWISEHGQSYERKCAHARARIDVLQAGLAELDPKARLHVQSRLD